MTKVSKFDRVISGGKKVWDKGQEDLPVISKPFRAVESKLEKKAEDYEKSGSPVKGKIARVGSVISGALTPTKFDAAITGAGALVKGTMVAKNAYKAYKSGKKAEKSAEEFAKSLKGTRAAVQSKNLEEIGERARMKSYGYEGTEGRIKSVAGPKKGSSHSTFYDTPETSEKVEKLRAKDMKNDFSLGPNSRVSEEFTSRGKKVGKPIGDQGGSRKYVNSDAADRIKIAKKNKIQKEMSEEGFHTVKNYKGKDSTSAMNPREVDRLASRDKARRELGIKTRVYGKMTKDPKLKKEIKTTKKAFGFKGRNYTKE